MAHERDQLQAVRSGDWKLFVPLDDYSHHPHFKHKPQAEPMLFNVVEDLSSTRDVAAQQPEVVARLLKFAEQARHDLGDRGRVGKGQRQPGRITGTAQPQRLSH